MNFRIVLPNQRIKNVECPSDLGIRNFFVRYRLEGEIQLVSTVERVDLILDEDGYATHLEEIEEWVT